MTTLSDNLCSYHHSDNRRENLFLISTNGLFLYTLGNVSKELVFPDVIILGDLIPLQMNFK